MFLLALAGHAIHVCAWGWIACLAVCLGAFVDALYPTHALKGSTGHDWPRVWVLVGMGWAALSMWITLCAFSGWLVSPWFVMMTSVVSLMCGAYAWNHWHRSVRTDPQHHHIEPSYQNATRDVWFSGVMMAVLAIAACTTLSGALLPETLFDGLHYHLALPSQSLVRGVLHQPLNQFFAFYPQWTEMLYLLALALDGDITAKLIHWGFGVSCGAVLVTWGARWIGHMPALFAAVLWCAMPLVHSNAINAQIDMALSFFVLLSTLSWMEAILDRGEGKEGGAHPQHWLAVSAIFCGCACAIKYTGFLYAGGLWALTWKYGSLRHMCRYIALTMVFPAPWLIRNTLLWHNPIYPYGESFMSASALLQEQRGHAFAWAPLWEWIKEVVWNSPYGRRLVGPGIPLALFGSVLMIRLSKAKMFPALIWLLCYWTFMIIVVTRIARFYLPLLAVFSIVASGLIFPRHEEGGNTQRRGTWRWRTYTALLIGTILLCSIGQLAFSISLEIKNMDPFPYLIGQETQRQYLSHARPTYPSPPSPAFEFINKNLRNDVTILLVGELRSYGCERKILTSSAFQEPPFKAFLHHAQNAEALVGSLNQAGVTHLLVNEGEIHRLNEAYRLFWLDDKEIARYNIFVNRYCQLIFEYNGLKLYEIQPYGRRT